MGDVTETEEVFFKDNFIITPVKWCVRLNGHNKYFDNQDVMNKWIEDKKKSFDKRSLFK